MTTTIEQEQPEVDLEILEPGGDAFTVKAAMVIDKEGFSAPGLVYDGLPDDDSFTDFLLTLENGSVSAAGKVFCVLPTPQHMWVFLSMYGRYMLASGDTPMAVALCINDLFAARSLHCGGSLFGLAKGRKKTSRELAFITESHGLELVRTAESIAKERSKAVFIQGGRVSVRVDEGKGNTHFLRYANPHFANVIRVTLVVGTGTEMTILTPQLSNRDRLQSRRLCSQMGLTQLYHECQIRGTAVKRKREDGDEAYARGEL